MEKVTINVIRVKQPSAEFFIGSIPAEELVKITYSDVRRINNEDREVERYLGIQRPLDKSRVAEIKRYITSPNASFPTGIVLSIHPRHAEFNSDNSILELSPAVDDNGNDGNELIKLGRVAKVLDGQHRIAAFLNKEGNYDWTLGFDKFDLNVVIFIGLDLDEQANIFATINLAQTKVNKSLVYDLEGLSKIRSPFKSAHQIAVALDTADDSSPLYKRIKRLGVKTAGRENSEPLTQAVFVESLIALMSGDPEKDRLDLMKKKKLSMPTENELHNYPFRKLYIENKEKEIALILYNYFAAIKHTWPNAWEDVNRIGNILPKSNAFKAFMRYLKELYITLSGGDFNMVISLNMFLNHFKSYDITDEDFTSGNFLPGSGGQSRFYKLLTREITISELKNG